ncbi:MAG: hypothetical protein RXN92_02710 [Thermoplasmatales archaeon]
MDGPDLCKEIYENIEHVKGSIPHAIIFFLQGILPFGERIRVK